MSFFRHPSAEISQDAEIGEGTKIWHFAQVRENVKIGKNCILGKGVYLDYGVIVGNSCKIQNNVSIFNGVIIDDEVFIGPHVCFTNDKYPRATNHIGEIKKKNQWNLNKTYVKKKASIGANSTILPGIIIGEYSLIGAGSVVTKDVPPFTLVYGVPALPRGKINKAGKIIY